MSRTIEIRTGSRLHFGLFSFGDPSCPHQYGGAGVMLRSPGLHLCVEEAPAFEAAGKHAERVARFASRVAGFFGWPSLPACRVEVLAAPRQHVGLGTGTQLGLAVARLLAEWNGLHNLPAPRLALASGRGLRSTVGIHSFEHGGLVIDAGHNQPGELGKLEGHCLLPADWRFVLVIDTAAAGLAQQDELNAFQRLPPAPAEVTARLRGLALHQMLPAARSGEFDRFARSLYEYGTLAGECFASIQGGLYASEAIARRVALLRELGLEGCGQSSWGPTVFAPAASEAMADEVVDRLIRSDAAEGCEVVIVEVAGSGACLDESEDFI